MQVVAHSVAELNGLEELAGYGSPASLEDAMAVGQPVIAFLVASPNAASDPDPAGFKVLTGVRKEDQVYPWAISVATSELTHDDAGEILADASELVLIDSSPVNIAEVPDDEQRELSTYRQVVKTYRGKPQRLSLDAAEGDSKLVTVTRKLFERKFDLRERAKKMGLDGAIGTVSLHHVAVGLVGEDNGRIEYNTNFSAAVMVPRELISGETTGYYSNSWVSPDDFIEGFRRSNPEQINPDLDDTSLAFVCRRGQCLRSAADALSNMDLLQQHLGLVE